MSTSVTESVVGSDVEVYYGDKICQVKTKLFLKEAGLPNGLLPLEDIEECGYAKDTGFVWLKQKKKKEHKFDKVGRLVSYGTEVTAYVEKKKIKKLTGVKAKEMLMWLDLDEINVVDDIDNYSTGNGGSKIIFKVYSGLFRSFPASAFEIVDDNEKN